ncbi:Sec1-like protein [Nadsonia fulvescens var. elongata DSM 6958]|uniref:Sec1-like protein n=1 Tax=Nadsonia fulvescens var. elongata DSM 6958 TaxID=857566 RepID=A0A1E3PE66_9ASCO|nr:Sec1-like protein [Nadsonia fulvescens var. elongata DSM 6958]
MDTDDTLRARQTAAIISMLNLNKPTDAGQDTKPDAIEDGPIFTASALTPWKVLIYDQTGRDVISSVLRVNDLLENGVTVHMTLNSERYPIPDVPAIYFIAPTEANIQRLSQDIAAQLYDSYYINFTSPLPRALLEEFAALNIHTAGRINQVYDQYLDFIVTAPNLYSLGMPEVYSELNRPSTGEEAINAIIDKIVSGLFSVIMTAGSIPVIRASRGNAAEMVAQKLDAKLRDHVLNSRGSSLSSSSSSRGSSSRPVLVILDRNIDLVPMVSHSWTYQCLISDVMEFKLNRVSIETPGEAGAAPAKKSYDLDPRDFFWSANASLPFPEVADNLDAQLTKYKVDAAQLTGGRTDLDDIMGADSVPSTSAHLKTAITALPELTARKRTIDMHMNIATALLKGIGERGLAQFFEAEENISRQTRASVLEAINNPEFKAPEDKLRFFLIYYLTNKTEMTRSELSTFEKALADQGCDLAALAFVKKFKEMAKLSSFNETSASSSTGAAASTTTLFKGFGGLTSKLTERLKDGGKLTEGFGNILANVRNLLPANSDLPVTRIVASLTNNSYTNTNSAESNTIADDYLYFDPRSTRGALTQPPPRGGEAFDDAVVFVVGGGNYLEYTNLQEWASGDNGVGGKRVVYGSTDLVTPTQMLKEFAQLA